MPPSPPAKGLATWPKSLSWRREGREDTQTSNGRGRTGPTRHGQHRHVGVCWPHRPLVAPEGAEDTAPQEEAWKGVTAPPGAPCSQGGHLALPGASLSVTARGGVPGTHHANARHAQDSTHVRAQARRSTEPEVPLWGAHHCLPGTSQGDPWGGRHPDSDSVRRVHSTHRRQTGCLDAAPLGRPRAGGSRSISCSHATPEGLDLRGQGHWGTAQGVTLQGHLADLGRSQDPSPGRWTRAWGPPCHRAREWREGLRPPPLTPPG